MATIELRDVSPTNASDARVLGHILRRATNGAVMRERRIQIGFDELTGSYSLGVAVPA